MREEIFEKNFEEGEILFREGDPGDEIYLIEKGKIKIFKEVEGKEKVIAILNEGDIFGEMSVLDGKPRSASARVLEDAVLRIINREALIQQIKENPFIDYIIATLIRRLRTADEQIKLLSIKHEELRLLIFILSISYEKRDINIKETSVITGIEIERLQEFFSKLENGGFLRIEKEKVIPVDLKKLEKYKNSLLSKQNEKIE